MKGLFADEPQAIVTNVLQLLKLMTLRWRQRAGRAI
jgi:hypothetical protein